MSTTTFTEWAHHKHDVFANQKYGGNLPYSFHLKAARQHADNIWRLVNQDYVANPFTLPSEPFDGNDVTVILYTADGHDLIEDARQTFNDIKNKLLGIPVLNPLANDIAQSIFNCTESTGRNRDERHDAAYKARLTSDRRSCVAKIGDISANVMYGLNSSAAMIGNGYSTMPLKNKKEWYGPSGIPELPETHTGLRKDIITAFPELRKACEYLDNIFKLVA